MEVYHILLFFAMQKSGWIVKIVYRESDVSLLRQVHIQTKNIFIEKRIPK